MVAPVFATAVALGGAAIGLWLTGAARRARFVVPFAAGVLLGVALFGLLPELVADIGWLPAALLFAAGYGTLLLVNRYVYPVCPTCSHDHDHNACARELHGFAVPLISAMALHSFLDGWSVVAAQIAEPLGLRVAVPLAVALHKLPEGVALGSILLASVKSRTQAMLWCTLAEGATLVGGAVGLLLAPHLGSVWTTYPLGFTAGWLCYLGYHAIHEEWRRRGAAPALTAALSGIAGSAVIQHGAEALFR